MKYFFFFFFQAEDGIRDRDVTGVQTCALPIANLYLQDGVWNGERILPEGYVKFVSTLAPAWKADGRPIYGGLFWLNGDSTFPAPKEAFYMTGVGGQTVLIIPSHQLAIVRLGHYKGVIPGNLALRKAVGILIGAVPPA